MKEHKKVVFLLTFLFSPVKYRDRNSEKIDFLKKNLKNFWNHKVVWNGIQKVQPQFCKIYAKTLRKNM